jgi:hypothetical protein
VKKTQAKPKFNFEQLKAAATHLDVRVRMKAFAEYFEMFQEFPSYLFDNAAGIDATLLNTIEKLKDDPATSKEMKAGIDLLLNRLPSPRTN